MFMLLQVKCRNASVTPAVTPINIYSIMSYEETLQRYTYSLYPYVRARNQNQGGQK